MKRFDLVYGYCGEAVMTQDDAGDWVRYDDAAAELARVTEERERETTALRLALNAVINHQGDGLHHIIGIAKATLAALDASREVKP